MNNKQRVSDERDSIGDWTCFEARDGLDRDCQKYVYGRACI
jgi:hypothetical protein